jgi:hypothetical protein
MRGGSLAEAYKCCCCCTNAAAAAAAAAAAGKAPIRIDEVEDAAEIMKRFCTGGMSLGAISREVSHHTLVGFARSAVADKALAFCCYAISPVGVENFFSQLSAAEQADTENGMQPVMPRAVV